MYIESEFALLEANNEHLTRKNKKLVAALEEVEFVSITDQERCPWCGGIRTDYPARKLVEGVGFIVGHTDDCSRQQALAQVKGDQS